MRKQPIGEHHADIPKPPPPPAPPAPVDGFKLLNDLFNDNIVVMQAAVIEWKHGGGAEAAMAWIWNTLWGPGLLPEDGAPYSTDAQAWFDAHKSNPFPTCHCGRPSNILSKGSGYCSDKCRVTVEGA